MCFTKVICLTLSLHSTENRVHSTENRVLPFWAHCILKTVRDRNNWLDDSERSYCKESNEKKIPSKLDEK